MTNEMTAEEAVKQIKGNCYFASISEKTKESLDLAIKALEVQEQGIKEAYDKGYEYGVKDWFDKRTKAQTCIEDYPTCTECEHYDSEKHYCPRLCQVIKDTLAEAQPCEDCISREAVEEIVTKEFVNLQDGTEEWRSAVNDVVEEILHKVEDLSSVTPQRPKGKWIPAPMKVYGYPLNCMCSKCGKQEPCEDCISRKMAVEAVAEALKNSFVEYEDIAKKIISKLPSVTPQRPKGKWIYREDMGHQYCCSECGCPKPFVNDYYYKKIIGCPYCLADMSGGGEDEVSD